MKLTLDEVTKLITWIQRNQQTVELIFPNFRTMKVTLPKMRGKDKEIIQKITKPQDEEF